MEVYKKGRSVGFLSLLKEVLSVNRQPVPWVKAFSAGVAAGLPIILGLLLGRLDYGLIACLGSFAYLYVFNIPYAKRGKKLFYVVIGMTILTVIGTLVASNPFVIAIMIALIGYVAVFIFGALRITGPSAIFFILVFSIISAMPVAPNEALLRAGLVFIGGALSWMIAMVGWFFHPHAPEESVIKRVYMELATFIESVGTNHYQESKYRMMAILNEADGELASGYIPWHETDLFKRLYLLNKHARSIYLYMIEYFPNKKEPLPGELAELVRELAHTFDYKRANRKYNQILEPENLEASVKDFFTKIYNAESIMNESTSNINQAIQFLTLPVKTILGAAFDKNSMVFITALRFGFITLISALVAYGFNFERSYWVPLSSVAVMSGATILATQIRAIQRGIGTIIGIIIASLILVFEPTGYSIPFFIFILTFITELFIVKNYGLAAMFFTPNALLMAESTSNGSINFSYFASVRMMDVIIGSVIGLIGVRLMGRKSASSRLPHLVTKSIRSQAQLLLVLLSAPRQNFHVKESKELRKMRINITNLRMMYDSASGEIPLNKEVLNDYWPVIYSIEHLGFLLEDGIKTEDRYTLPDQELAQLFYACEKMANPHMRSSVTMEIPIIEQFPSIQKELMSLQKSLKEVKPYTRNSPEK